MKPAKINQTVVLLKPLSAHCADSAGVLRTRPKAAAMLTPARPRIAGGIGSVMMPAITATNSAKYRHAFVDRPSGTGATLIAMPIASGTSIGHATADSLIDWGESYSTKIAA